MQVKIIDFKSGAKAHVFLRGGFTWCLYMMQGKHKNTGLDIG